MNRWLPGLAVLCLAWTATAQQFDAKDALLSPLPVRDQFLLSNGFLFFTPESTRTVDPGQWAVSLSAADANTFAKSAWISRSLEGRTTRAAALTALSDSRFQSPATLFLVDGESHRTDLTISRGFDNAWELRVSVPFVSTGGGWSDRLIEATHHAMRIGNAERESLRRNTETVFLRHDGRTYVRARGRGLTIGDIAFSAKYELTPRRERDTNLSVVTSVELPTGNSWTLDGSGSLDAGVEMVVSRDFDHTRINATLGLLRLGSNAALGLRSQVLITDTVSVARQIGRSAAAIAQLTVSESPFRQLGTREFSRRSYQLSIGMRRQFRVLTVYGALIENVIAFENSADAGVAWGVSRAF